MWQNISVVVCQDNGSSGRGDGIGCTSVGGAGVVMRCWFWFSAGCVFLAAGFGFWRRLIQFDVFCCRGVVSSVWDDGVRVMSRGKAVVDGSSGAGSDLEVVGGFDDDITIVSD